MLIETMLNNLINWVYFEPIVAIAVFIAFIGALRVTSNKSYLKQIEENKLKQKKLIDILVDELNDYYVHLSKLSDDLNVVGQYNTLHADNIIKYTQKSRYIYDYLELLQDNELKQKSKDFIENARFIAKEIKEMEEKYYMEILEYQKTLTKTKPIDNSVEESRSNYIKNINKAEQLMLELKKYYRLNREKLYGQIRLLIEEKRDLEASLVHYKKKKVESKRFYPRHVSFA